MTTRRLMVGSEGTLAFVTEDAFDALPLPRMISAAWIPMLSINEAVFWCRIWSGLAHRLSN